MRRPKHLETVLIAAAAVLVTGARMVPGSERHGPVTNAMVAIGKRAPVIDPAAVVRATSLLESETSKALTAFTGLVKPLSRPEALEDAFHSYFAYKNAHPGDVKKPYLYFVDYGLPSTETRGYVLDMDSLRLVDGPFTVAHGRGSSTSQYGVPTRFGNASGSAETSLGLYLTSATYAFTGHTGGHTYGSIGMRLLGVSTGFNDLAFARGVVVHGAPYVTPTKAGRSEGCPAMEPVRAQRLLPKLANGAMVFLFAPDQHWLAGDPWVTASGE